MDNDGNDYQSQNLPLVGEESSRISSILQPYSLPKFDFDDSLQGHLRFDSLVENEVFLGITSQEDNNWIEDFSRGSSGLGFNSSAAESCSIPRHVNVWSEATSSESVEMLLKSVRQAEMVPEESVIEGSDACDELGTLAKQMELNLRQGEKIDDHNSSQALQAVQELGNSSGPNRSSEDMGINFERTSKTQEIEHTAFEHPEVEQTAFQCSGANLENMSLVLTEGNSQIYANPDDENRQKPDTSPNEALNDKMEEPTIISITQINAESSSQHTNMDVENLSDQNKVVAKHLESASNKLEEVCEGMEEQSAEKNDSGESDKSVCRDLPKIGASNSDSPLHVALSIKTTQNVEDPYSGPEREDFTSRNVDENRHDLHSVVQNSQTSVVLVHAENTQIIEQSIENCEKSSGGSQGEASKDWHATVRSEVVADRIDAELQQAKDFLLQTLHVESSSVEVKESCTGNQSPVGECASATASEDASVLNSELHSNMSGIKVNHGLPSLTDASSSAEFAAEEHVTDNSKEKNDAAELHKEDLLPYVPVGIEVSVETSSDKVNTVEDGSVCGEQSLKDADSTSGTLNNVAERLSSSSLDEEVQEKIEAVHGLELDRPSRIDCVLNVGASDMDVASGQKASDNIHSLLVTDTRADQNEEKKSSSDLGVPMHSDKKEDMHSDKKEDMHLDKKEEVCEVYPDTNRPNIEELSQVGNEAVPVSLAEKIMQRDNASEAKIRADQAVLTVEMRDAASPDEVVDDPKISKELSVKIEVEPVPCDSKLGGAKDAEAVTVGKHKETNIEDTRGEEHSEISGGGRSGKADELGHDSVGVVAIEHAETEKRAPIVTAIGDVAGNSDNAGAAVVSVPVDAGASEGSKEERSFTFDVNPLAGLSMGENSMGWKSFPNTKACMTSMAEKVSTPTSSSSQKDHITVQEVSQPTSQMPEGGIPSGGPRTISERKTRRGAAKSGKDSAKKGNNVKERTPLRQPERGDSPCVSVNPSGSGQLLQFDVGSTDRCGTKLTLPGPTSNLPDLNTSIPTSPMFRQPFTDLQQVQLRSQIFVYGSLIQGAAPDEACMVSAFGSSDGGRSVWEASFRACVERLHGQKTIANIFDTPVQSRSGPKAQDQSVKQGLSQSKVITSPATPLTCKGTPSAAVNPMIPLSSPLWSISTPTCGGLPSSNVARGAVLNYQALPPLHPYQTPPMRTVGGHTSSWLSQAPFPGPWVASPQSSAFDFSARLSSLPTTETVKLTPVRDPSIAITSGTKHGLNASVAHGGKPSNLASASSIQKMTGSPSPVQHSADPKSRKRKKSIVTEDPPQIPLAASLAESECNPVINQSLKKGRLIDNLGPVSLLARNLAESVSTPVIGGHFSTSVAVTASPSFVPKSLSDKILTAASPALSTDHLKRMDPNTEKSTDHAEDFSKVEEAKQQAESAAAHAASAVSHCQSLWSQLGKQRTSGLVSDIEAKLSSAAAAIAAAASVAKAAAAAAKIASSAALQAKQMADEAFISIGNDISVHKDASSMSNVTDNLGGATPASILKGGDGNDSSNPIISAAREAARRRVEAASAASRHAENLDAIVKAAELAAEAVSQAGKVVAMGEPMPLSVLVEAGPEKYWKGSEVPSEQVGKLNAENEEKRNTESSKEVPKQSEGPSDQEKLTTSRGRSLLSRDINRNIEDNMRMEEGTSASLIHGEKDFRGQKGRRASDLAKATASTEVTQDNYNNGAGMLKDNGIKENSLVEVFKEGGRFKGAWYSANVLSLNNGKALVCYTELQSDEGSELLREWVPLEGEGNEVPIIRIPHPMSSMRFEGTRKRRRAAVRDYNWSVGDRVDAWIEDCWREGVITEKNKNDATMLTVHFPAQGETSVVRAWQLRPTLMWKNGEWIELPTSQNSSSQGDTPRDKRQRLGSPANEDEGKGNTSKNMGYVDSEKAEEPKLLPLSSSEKVFNIGRSRDESKTEAPRMKRSGLQKEGSKVIFGVPKPGKKRKFMEVSKHYVSEGSTKNSVSKDSGKVSRYAMPLGSGPRGWKNNSKIDVKEKHAAESKLKPPRSGKLPGVLSRTIQHKENSLSSSVSSQHETTTRSNVVKDSISNNENESGRPNGNEPGSVSNIEAAVEVPTSSRTLPSDNTKKSSTNAKPERLTKGKLTLAGGRSTKVEAKDIPEVTEPRRSNRKIQPTSRLLEGLQSSLVISKIPSSHDKGQKSRNRVASRGTSNRG